MVNLIPPDARHYVVIEYWVRTVTVWLFLIAIALIAIAIFLIPPYTLIHGEISLATANTPSGTFNQQSFTALQQQVTTANTLATQLATSKSTPVFSQYLNKIDSLAPTGVIVSTISMERKNGVIPTITIDGHAATRLSLAKFRDALQAAPAFSAVDLPLSNLARDKDIPFSIKVTTVTKQPTS